MEEIRMKRKVATELIDDVRAILARAKSGNLAADKVHLALGRVFDDHHIPGLKMCTGEAHSNAFIDDCSCCKPRWGVVGPKVKVT